MSREVHKLFSESDKILIKQAGSIQNGHGYRVGKIACKIAKLAGLHSLDIKKLRLAGKMHDTGKLLVPNTILEAPRALNPEEKAIVRQHPSLGLGILLWHKKNFPIEVLDAMLMHHERWDGAGYPLGLKEEQIPLSVRVITLADVIDALASHREYRGACDIAFIRHELEEGKGSHFDPDLADVCLKHLDEILATRLTAKKV
ncbi:HD-GYP domain-containing protein [Acetobacter okinawensis]|uniref:HD-GYP domain-containing protein n=1 Tax=Acetobacter okinawensis TaxID=1076594 RepID=UPI001BADF962|nr:HD domain-containing phosphohydrolase [Acetobacter okinawensis]MBS0966258.1 HD domain-containing protein [Acetobacter okinawensis]MBS0987263.1 HD domain-containing protein [Acetobacter okinawensis]MCP1212798.1 HD domain-containing protein [Acetobacter okinawensis]